MILDSTISIYFFRMIVLILAYYDALTQLILMIFGIVLCYRSTCSLSFKSMLLDFSLVTQY